MYFYHADDYGINIEQSERIIDCRVNGCLNSVSIIPNSEHLDETMPLLDADCKKAVHINLCEGKSLSDKAEIPLLVNKDGMFDKSFLKILLLSFTQKKELERQISDECYLQIKKVLSYMPEGYKLRVDSHRHYHMIPSVMRGLVDAIERTGLDVEYLRLPMERFSLYLSQPGLWPRISVVSIIKALVLDTCGAFDKKFLKSKNLWNRDVVYLGVLFTDRMFFENIDPLVRKIRSKKCYNGFDVEVQFHPGAIKRGEELLDDTFGDWYASTNREGEALALKRLGEK